MAGIDLRATDKVTNGLPQAYTFGASIGIQNFAPLDTNLGQSLKIADTAKKAGDAATKSTQGIDWFGDNGVIGSTGAALNGIANIWGAYNSFTQGKAQLNEMRRQNDLLEQQYRTETERYNKREAERDASNEYFQNMANGIYQRYYANYGNANSANNASDTAKAENALINGTNDNTNAQNAPQNQLEDERNKNVLPTERI